MRPQWRRGSLVVLVLLAATAGLRKDTSAQPTRTLPRRGQYALSFGVPEGGGAGIGVRKQLSERRNAGVTVTFGTRWEEIRGAAGDSDSRTSWAVGVAPDLRLYRRSQGPVVPFVLLGGRSDYARSTEAGWSFQIGATVGTGVEWFPLRSMSLSGSVGLTTTYGRWSREEAALDSFNLSAGTSRLSLNLYF